ncbi:fatty acid--CoA ligase [Endozoicomonas montiporae]|uniref:Fatty acid--CoA ligase n=2 Tax=Endozoicomonas montiporae TaxID=1027273 RepID=A0A081N871_9GAMM|nr:FadD3 family acyl-CoA ligase [Endozoicomonas montiporae]AMO55468.1 acyl-CoA synthetase [Endozoicomonas montiporae CL-33]KEQ14644.1 fatty acid--CoA ligase [Endozoicomonas montiporae]
MADPITGNTIPEMMDRVASQFAERHAIEDGDVTLTYQQLDRLRVQAAASLLAMGVERGDRVAIWAPNIWEWVVCALGLQTAGAALVPLNTRMKGSEAAYVLRSAGVNVLFCIDEFLGCDYSSLLESEDLPELDTIITFRPSVPGTNDKNRMSFEHFLTLGEKLNEERIRSRQSLVSAEDMSDLLFTSGTTGKPKGVVTGHKQNLGVIADWSEVVGLQSGDRYLIVNPFFHSFGYKAGFIAALMRGCTIIPMQVFDVDAILQAIASEKVSVLPGPPTLYQSILSKPDLDRYDLSSLRVAVTGAAAIPVSMIHNMHDRLGFDTIITAYGLTEVCGFATICRSGDDPELIATTSGRAMPGVEVLCVDPDGQEVTRGEPGEVVIRGHNVMAEYFNNPVATNETIDENGWLHTGDIGVMNDAGYLRITDRIKDMIITGGFNVYPAEIENVLSAHQSIAQVAIVGVPDERMGEVAMAYIIPSVSSRPKAEDIITWCRQQMANYKVPRHVRFVDSLPLNASGKVLKFQLREMAKTEVA